MEETSHEAYTSIISFNIIIFPTPLYMYIYLYKVSHQSDAFRATLYHTVNVFVLRLAGKSPDMFFFRANHRTNWWVFHCHSLDGIFTYIYSPSFFPSLFIIMFVLFLYFFISVCLSFFLYFFKTIYYYIDLNSLFEHFICYIIGDKHCT